MACWWWAKHKASKKKEGRKRKKKKTTTKSRQVDSRVCVCSPEVWLPSSLLLLQPTDREEESQSIPSKRVSVCLSSLEGEREREREQLKPSISLFPPNDSAFTAVAVVGHQPLLPPSSQSPSVDDREERRLLPPPRHDGIQSDPISGLLHV